VLFCYSTLLEYPIGGLPASRGNIRTLDNLLCVRSGLTEVEFRDDGITTTSTVGINSWVHDSPDAPMATHS
jgi:hypothetical protein